MSGSERTASMPIGVVVERSPTGNRWQPWRWRVVEILPGAPPPEGWRELPAPEGVRRWHAATLPLELHRTATDDYRYNLSARVPSVYVVLRHQGEGERPYAPILVTVAPSEAQSYGEFGDDLINALPMPPGLLAWVEAFVERHHVERPFKKRKRKGTDPEALAALNPFDPRTRRDGPTRH